MWKEQEAAHKVKQMGLETQPGSREWHWVELRPWKVVLEKKLSQRCAKPLAFDLGGSKWDTTRRAEQSCCTAHSKAIPLRGEQEKQSDNPWNCPPTAEALQETVPGKLHFRALQEHLTKHTHNIKN